MDTPKNYSYVRYSSDRQIDGSSTERQREMIATYARTKAWEIEREFYDPGKSAWVGANISDGQLGEFFRQVREKEIAPGSRLLMESLDRFSRLDPIRSVPYFLELLGAGIDIVSVTDGMVHSSNADPLQRSVTLFQSMTWLTQSNRESEQKSLRLKEAWETKRAEIGKLFYSGRVPKWILVVGEKTKHTDTRSFELHKPKAKIVKKIFELCLEGEHCESIARKFHRERVMLVGGGKCWSHSYVSQILRSPATMGDFTPNMMVKHKREPAGPTITGYYPAVVTKQVFDRVQLIMDGRSKNKGRGGRVSTDGSSLFWKRLFCGYCGAPVYRTAKGRYYKGALRKTLLCRNAKEGTGCFYVGWDYNEFEQSFVAAVPEFRKALVARFDGKPMRVKLESLKGEQRRVANEHSKTLRIIPEQETKIAEAAPKLWEHITTLERRLKNIAAEIKAVERKTSLLTAGAGPVAELEATLAKLATPKQRKIGTDLIGQLFEKIVLYPAGNYKQFAGLKGLHRQLVRKRGKADGHVSAKIRERFDRRKLRFFEVFLNEAGEKNRFVFRSDGRPLDPVYMPDDEAEATENIPSSLWPTVAEKWSKFKKEKRIK